MKEFAVKTNGRQKEVLQKAFRSGYEWTSGGNNYKPPYDVCHIIYFHDNKTLTWSKLNLYYKDYKHIKLIEAEDFLVDAMKGYFVETITPDICELVQKHAFNLGYEWSRYGKTIQFKHESKYIILTNEGKVYREIDYVDESKYSELSLKDFFELDGNININGYEVLKTENGIRFIEPDGTEDECGIRDRSVELSLNDVEKIYNFAYGRMTFEDFIITKTQDGIKFGCTNIPMEDIERVYKFAKEK